MPPQIGEHLHPSLRRRIRIFLAMGTVMLIIMVWDVVNGTMSIPLALIGVVVGGVVGFFSSRIFHLSWDHDGQKVVSRIDTIGWVVLAVYIALEIARVTAFDTVFKTGYSATAITFAFVASALLARVLGLRGRILVILKEEKVLG